MKKTILLLILVMTSLICFSQKNKPSKDTTIKSATLISKDTAVKKLLVDTMDISHVNILKLDGTVIPVSLLRGSRWVLTESQVATLLSALGKLPYEQSATTIQYVKQFFGIPL